jgi:hypothetical protein
MSFFFFWNTFLLYSSLLKGAVFMGGEGEEHCQKGGGWEMDESGKR